MSIYFNPGNIEIGQGYAGETGEAYGEGRFPAFENAQMGTRALFKDLRTKLRKFKGDIPSMIRRYAPPSENETKNYINFVIKNIGKDKIEEEDLPAVARAIIKMENSEEGRKYYLDDPKILEEGYKLSTLDLPHKASYEDAVIEFNTKQVRKNIGGMVSRNPYLYNPRPI